MKKKSQRNFEEKKFCFEGKRLNGINGITAIEILANFTMSCRQGSI
jgi:hypothetical protein